MIVRVIDGKEDNRMDDCIEYSNAKYPRVRINGRKRLVSRLLLAISDPSFCLQGPLEACHKCDNSRCIRVEHLFSGTSGDNIRDSVTKDRHRGNKKSYLCKRGHVISGLDKSGKRFCKVCASLASRLSIIRKNRKVDNA